MEGMHARCVENEPLALFILEQRQQALVAKDGYKEKLDAILSKAYRNVCEYNRPICSLHDASQIQGIGQWVLKLLKGFFPDIHSSQEANGKDASKEKRKRRYLPQKSSAPYAILLTLYKAMQEGRDHMRKQELIDAADASGLSRMAIQPSKCAGPSAQFGHSTKDWYSGWTSMKTLITKGLVFKSSCPAKYKLTEEGISTAEECLERSGIQKITTNLSVIKSTKNSTAFSVAMVDEHPKSLHAREYTDLSVEENLANCSANYKLTEGRISTADVCIRQPGLQALKSSNESNKKRSAPLSSALVAECSKVSCVEEVAHLSSDSDEADDTIRRVVVQKSQFVKSFDTEDSRDAAWDQSCSPSCNKAQFSKDHTGASNVDSGDKGLTSAWLHLPPLSYGERFSDVYTVVLILDYREQFMNPGKGNTREKFADQIRSQFQIEVEVRHLPVGDTLWLARHKVTGEEFVLDFIVERKNVTDLLSSIRDTRYKQQKLRLMRCGLRKLIYVVEGDLNVMDSAESIKTACLTTEIVEGFDVQRTTDVRDTMRKYGHLTHAISAHYDELSSRTHPRNGLCKTFRQFVDDCKDLDKVKVSDVFGIMLMQIRQVTENVALTILEKYPTPLSLVMAYSRLKGDEKAQENLLKGLPIINQNKEISSIISKRVFQFICVSNTK